MSTEAKEDLIPVKEVRLTSPEFVGARFRLTTESEREMGGNDLIVLFRWLAECIRPGQVWEITTAIEGISVSNPPSHRIKLPRPDQSALYTLMNLTTGEIRECADLAVLLRCIGDELGQDHWGHTGPWQIGMESTGKEIAPLGKSIRTPKPEPGHQVEVTITLVFPGNPTEDPDGANQAAQKLLNTLSDIHGPVLKHNSYNLTSPGWFLVSQAVRIGKVAQTSMTYYRPGARRG